MSKKVLIGCPIYEGDVQYLEGFLDSIRSQTFSNFDILFADTSKEENFSDKLRKTGAFVVRAPSKSGKMIDNIVSGRNAVRDFFLEHDYGFLWFVDADVRPPKDALERLMASNKKLISGIYLGLFENGSVVRPCLWSFADEKGVCRQLGVKHVSGDDIIEIAIAGLGCALISREVLVNNNFDLLETGSEDTAFFVRALRNGFKVYADLGVKCSHLVFDVGNERNKKFSF